MKGTEKCNAGKKEERLHRANFKESCTKHVNNAQYIAYTLCMILKLSRVYVNDHERKREGGNCEREMASKRKRARNRFIINIDLNLITKENCSANY